MGKLRKLLKKSQGIQGLGETALLNRLTQNTPRDLLPDHTQHMVSIDQPDYYDHDTEYLIKAESPYRNAPADMAMESKALRKSIAQKIDFYQQEMLKSMTGQSQEASAGELSKRYGAELKEDKKTGKQYISMKNRALFFKDIIGHEFKKNPQLFHPDFSVENGKLSKQGIAAWSIPPHTFCPGAGALCSRCYGKSGPIAMGGSAIRKWVNHFASTRPEFESEAIRCLQEIKKNPQANEGKLKADGNPAIWDWDTIRWHDTGDFHSAEYANKIANIIRSTPDLKHYFYSKSFGADEKDYPGLARAVQMMSNLPNAKLIQSLGSRWDEKVDPTKPIAAVFERPGQGTEDGWSDASGGDRTAADPAVMRVGLAIHKPGTFSFAEHVKNAPHLHGQMQHALAESNARKVKKSESLQKDEPQKPTLRVLLGQKKTVDARTREDKLQDAMESHGVFGGKQWHSDDPGAANPGFPSFPNSPEKPDSSPKAPVAPRTNLRSLVGGGKPKKKVVAAPQLTVASNNPAPIPTSAPATANTKEIAADRLARVRSSLANIAALSDELNRLRGSQGGPVPTPKPRKPRAKKIKKSEDLRSLIKSEEKPLTFSPGTEKLREIRDHIDTHGGTMEGKELEKRYNLGSMGLSHLKDGKGNVSSARIQHHIDNMPKVNYHVSESTFGDDPTKSPTHPSHPLHAHYKTLFGKAGEELKDPLASQLHSGEPSKVLQINFTPQHMEQLRNSGLHRTYDSMNRASAQSGHPVKEGNGIGWVRYSEKPDGLFIDEIQSDLAHPYGRIFEQQAQLAKETGFMDDDAIEARRNQLNQLMPEGDQDKIRQLAFGDKHPSQMLLEAFHNWARQNGHAGKPIHMWATEGKKAAVLSDLDQAAPAHMQATYGQIPRRLGYEPATYGEIGVQSGPHAGKQTQKTILRKSEPLKKARDLMGEAAALTQKIRATNAKTALRIKAPIESMPGQKKVPTVKAPAEAPVPALPTPPQAPPAQSPKYRPEPFHVTMGKKWKGKIPEGHQDRHAMALHINDLHRNGRFSEAVGLFKRFLG